MFAKAIIIYFIVQNVYGNKNNYYPSVPLVTNDPSMFNYLGLEIILKNINDTSYHRIYQPNQKLLNYVVETNELKVNTKLNNFDIRFVSGNVTFNEGEVKILMSTSNTLFQRRNDSYLIIDIICKKNRLEKDLAFETVIFRNLFASNIDHIYAYGYCLNSIEVYIKYKNTKTKVDFTKHVMSKW
ncbi:serine protease inhibitor-like protein [Cotia virus SPAn232]|uniref:Serine protease inhibitor-like protein n=2 Tax=Cotia virus TaxID=39444 RepID=H6TAF3_9POXV|nr:serine protease inhibitor-like protein [Cotia virus SPAn232]YP_005296373.1 serine protease inhibitor-like protein [Cotia virus SPAn232]AIT70616.1 serine protease inhibitor-like protein [Cotia virus]AFB76891.1 serine protease inhibitor-like protein [Cotia virus SPAn232]AFB76987.1 serine protease inhibitor-like protein [Cotia virus SPAn232]AIT70800.1 serine protease inhibitor-like protein [Cotia virus]